jgi:hypothetical protein
MRCNGGSTGLQAGDDPVENPALASGVWKRHPQPSDLFCLGAPRVDFTRGGFDLRICHFSHATGSIAATPETRFAKNVARLNPLGMNQSQKPHPQQRRAGHPLVSVRLRNSTSGILSPMDRQRNIDEGKFSPRPPSI